MLVSNEFVEDPQCQRMLNYAKDSLRKEILVLMVGKGREWQQSNIGMTLSEKVYINFQRIEQYEDKLVELSRRLKELTSGQQVSCNIFARFFFRKSEHFSFHVYIEFKIQSVDFYFSSEILPRY